MVSLALWVVVLGASALTVDRQPTALNVALLTVLLTLCAVSHLQVSALNWSRSWSWREATMLLYSSRYLSEIRGVAGRDAFLAALEALLKGSERRGPQPSLVLVSIPRLEAVRSAMGDLGGGKAVGELAKSIRRAARADDLVGYLGYGRFGVILTNCSREDQEQFLRRLPQRVAISIGDATERLDLSFRELDLAEGHACITGGEYGVDASSAPNGLRRAS